MAPRLRKLDSPRPPAEAGGVDEPAREHGEIMPAREEPVNQKLQKQREDCKSMDSIYEVREAEPPRQQRLSRSDEVPILGMRAN